MASQEPLLLFAPGAGAPSSSAFMTEWTKRLRTLGSVVPFDYPYQLAGRRSPDRLEVLIRAHLEALERARKKHPGSAILIGKSMGGRVGCHASLEADPAVSALICLGYPLVGQKGALRDEVLIALRTPILFVQGSADPLCPLDRLAEVRPRMKTRTELFVVEGGNHSLAVGKRALKERGETQAEVDEAVLGAIRGFVESEGLV